MTKSVSRLKARLDKLKKLRSSEEKEEVIQKFLNAEFDLPLLGFRKGRVVNFSPARLQTQKKVQASLEVSKETKQKMYTMTRNANKKLNRRDATIDKQMTCMKSKKQTHY